MAEVVRMPKLSDTMLEGVVAAWHKKIGDEISAGDLMAEIETDKATMEFESFQEGVLLHIGVEAGAAAPVNAILAILGEKGEDIKAILKEEEAAAAAASADKEEAAPAKEEAAPAPVAAPAAATPAAAPAPAAAPKKVTKAAPGGRVKASPLAKRLAEERGINLSYVQGSGDGGRIVKRDLDDYQGGGAPQVESFTDVTASQMRKTIGRRLSESKFSAPHFYITMDINMDNAMEARKQINAVAPSKVSFNDLVVKAVGLSLKKNPQVNCSWLGDRIRYNDHVHLGVAVAVEDGLLVPVVRFADTKRLTEISGEVRDFAQRAKDKKLQPQDWEGSTFTISNLGMFGVEEFTAIVNPPDACILAIGGIKNVPVVKNGAVVPGNVMKVTLSCDHRAVDGALGAAFLQTFKSYMENPVLLLGERSI